MTPKPHTHTRTQNIIISVVKITAPAALALFFFKGTAVAQEHFTPKAGPVFDNTLYDTLFLSADTPNSSFAPMIRESLKAQQPNLGAQVWYSFGAPEGDADFDKTLLLTMLSVSKLTGTQYYSHRRQKYRDFIIESYRVHSVGENTPQPDEIPEKFDTGTPRTNDKDRVEYKIIWYRKDSSFGSGALRYNVLYNTRTHEIYARITNAQQIRYNDLLSIGDAEEMVIHVLITPSVDKKTYEAYALAAVNASKVPFKFLRRRVAISLMYRMYAIAQWVEKTARELLYTQ